MPLRHPLLIPRPQLAHTIASDTLQGIIATLGQRRETGVEVVPRFVAIVEENSDYVSSNSRSGDIRDIKVVFHSFLVLMIMGRCLLLWGHFIFGCSPDVFAEGRLHSPSQELHGGFTHDGGV